jgi:hypothetical protein
MGVPPVLIGIVSATYAIRSIISINKRRTEFNELLSHNLSLYYRLMCLAGTEALLTVPIAGLFYNVTVEDTHSYFNRVELDLRYLRHPVLFLLWIREGSNIALPSDLQILS